MIHEAFFYSSDEEFATELAPFLREAVAARHGAIAITTEHRIELLRRRLGDHAGGVSFLDASRWYRRPGLALLAWRDALDQQLRERVEFVRGIGEIPFGEDEVGIRNWTRYESLCNRAFAGRPAWLVCAYNTQVVPENILADARRTHPTVSTPSGRTPSQDHFGAQELGAALMPAEGRSEAEERSAIVSHPRDVADLRRSLRWRAHDAGLPVDVVDDLLLATGELVRASLAVDGAKATLRTGRRGGEWFCEVSCLRRAAADALPLREDDLGLLIGRVIADRVEVADDSDGSLVRFVFGEPSASPRQRILTAASDLFRANGIRSTGINAVIAHAGVAKATFYSQFRSKDDLIRLWLRSPALRWFDQVRAEVEIRSQSPTERMTTFFEVLGECLAEDGFRGCAFINTAAEFRDTEHESKRDLADLTREIEGYFRRMAGEAGLADPDGVGRQLFLLVPGTITTATARASAEPAHSARAAATGLLASAARA